MRWSKSQGSVFPHFSRAELSVLLRIHVKYKPDFGLILSQKNIPVKVWVEFCEIIVIIKNLVGISSIKFNVDFTALLTHQNNRIEGQYKSHCGMIFMLYKASRFVAHQSKQLDNFQKQLCNVCLHREEVEFRSEEHTEEFKRRRRKLFKFQ